ncbi:bifunctional adenosylcobinamide kinase/adenosylcobinamide-phosphate guanylyltransferase [Rhodococcus sp. G-MC3]|uniref:bifunctional adenosylcobinamide kinase/adenosylcobinamide-phosphate guanylyltransferase n=1 Tax=Rhodococcus sp. G-MC3 TaxID=3046209 RepID=UPI0024B9B033|nr:bifunctional adenosylcobinamide kinase/adenosylcobinamide-phosphate guanylyltransferase [Rhodococcus sp. G-MC3]MDJ0393035.1 bifunctional adenosylcobinamide kinase/adenosylcobinamide-phosphate guanylyltransferase [Rhodococcus sp. G-MC3]
MTPPLRTLVLGGARSGKSSHAEVLVGVAGPVRYVATGRSDPGDTDWEARIDEHRRRRPPEWTTVESPTDLPATVLVGDGVTIVDDLGTWLTGVLDDEAAWDAPRGTVAPLVDALVDAVRRCRHRVVMVSPEVGLSIVPDTKSGRLFRDELGVLNQRLAAVCDEVVLVVAGLPLTLKSVDASKNSREFTP